MKFMVRSLTLLLAMCLAFLAGFVARDPDSLPTPVIAQQPDQFPLLTEAQGYVEEYFVKEQPDPKAVEYALIRAYLSQLSDPYTFFIEPAVAASESQALAGRYGGIGVDIQRNEQGDFVLYPFENSPAARVGVLSGDIIVAINGTTLDLASTMDMVRQALRGEIVDGAGVTLLVRNIESGAERELFVPFEEILEPPRRGRSRGRSILFSRKRRSSRRC